LTAKIDCRYKKLSVSRIQVKNLIASNTALYIFFYDKPNGSFNHLNNSIKWNPECGMQLKNDNVMSPAIGLAHEMGHATQLMEGIITRDMWITEELHKKIEADNLARFETPIATELGEFTREKYGDAKSSYVMSNSTDWGALISNPDRSWWEFWKPGKVYESMNTWTPALK